MADLVLMPSLSPTMEEGVLTAWLKKVGDTVRSGDAVAQIETDKAIVEYEMLNEGVLRHFFVKAGDKIPVGRPIAILAETASESIEDLIAQGNSAGKVAAPSAPPPAPPKPVVAPTAAPTQATISGSVAAQYDVAIIGAGPGGYVAAIRAAQLGLKTAIIDKQWMGGVCLNVGCIPSKSLLKNAEIVETIQHRGAEFGFSVKDFKADYAIAVKRSRETSGKLTRGIEYLMRKNKVDVHMAQAAFKDSHTLELTDSSGKKSTLTAKNFIVATGANARKIPGVEVDGKKVLTYWEAILQTTCPKSAIVVGSGAIGVEFSTIWHAYGAEVTIVEMLPSIVPLEDQEVSEELRKAFNKRGIKTLLNTKVESIDTSGAKVKVKVSGSAGQQVLEAEQVLVAIGFVPNTQNLGLEKAGVNVEKGAIVIDEVMRTNVPHIYAIGDVTAKLMLAHVGSAMGIIAAEAIAGHATPKLQYPMMPRATYCHPQVASFGLTEAQAKEKGHNVKVLKFPFSANGKALGMGEGEGWVKIVVDGQYGELLGAHLIGPEVTELLPEFTLAQANEMTIEEIARNVHAHPTLSETIMEAAHGFHGQYIHI